jgi:hypothetical protein
MASKKLALLVAAIVGGTSLPELAQGGGAGGAGTGGNAGSATSSGAGTGTATGVTTGYTTGYTSGYTTGYTNSTGTSSMTGTGTSSMTGTGTNPSAAQANQNAGFGHTSSGLPVGSPGSGPGSPETPINSGSR